MAARIERRAPRTRGLSSVTMAMSASLGGGLRPSGAACRGPRRPCRRQMNATISRPLTCGRRAAPSTVRSPIGSVGVVDMEGASPPRVGPDALQAAGRALQGFQRLQHDASMRLAGGDAEASGDQGVGGLEGAGQRQADLVVVRPSAVHAEALALGFGRARGQGRMLAPASPTDIRSLARLLTAAAAKAGKASLVGVEHGGAAARQQGFEQAQLGGAIGVHGRHDSRDGPGSGSGSPPAVGAHARRGGADRRRDWKRLPAPDG